MNVTKRTIVIALIALLILSALLWGVISPAKILHEEGNKKVVFLTTADSHGKWEHEHQGAAKLLANRLKSAIPDVEVVILSGWPKDLAVLKGTSTIVVCGDGGGDHFLGQHLREIDNVLQSGAGLVMLHFALEIPQGEGGTHFQKWIGGYFETDWSVNPVWTARFDSLPAHPVTTGVGPFTIKDEWYYHMRFINMMNGITPILLTLPPDSTLSREDGTHSNNKYVRKAVLEDKKPQIMAWAFDRPSGGRGFGFTGGHYFVNWKDNNFRKIVLNAIAWTAKMEIPHNGIPSSIPDSTELETLSKK
jgi:type 1 glutamine amidotransferase